MRSWQLVRGLPCAYLTRRLDQVLIYDRARGFRVVFQEHLICADGRFEQGFRLAVLDGSALQLSNLIFQSQVFELLVTFIDLHSDFEVK